MPLIVDPHSSSLAASTTVTSPVKRPITNISETGTVTKPNHGKVNVEIERSVTAAPNKGIGIL